MLRELRDLTDLKKRIDAEIVRLTTKLQTDGVLPSNDRRLTASEECGPGGILRQELRGAFHPCVGE